MCFINLFEKLNANDRTAHHIQFLLNNKLKKMFTLISFFLLLLKCQNLIFKVCRTTKNFTTELFTQH